MRVEKGTEMDRVEKIFNQTTENKAERKEFFQDEMEKSLMENFYESSDLQRVEFAGDQDMLFKLNCHYPQVYAIAQKIAPDNKVLQLAAAYHDYGRAFQYREQGDFNDCGIGSEYDHHVVGYNKFLEDAPKLLSKELPEMAIRDSLKPGGVLYTVSRTILLHGLRGKAFEAEFAELSDYPEAEEAVDAVSLIDDIANGTQCVGYLLREGQERKKNVSAGGFIPDENQDLKTVSPKVMELFRESESFNRNAECKTYPDYYIFGCFLATRNLKNPATREITKSLIEQPISIVSHDTKDGEDVLVSQEFENGIMAFNHLFETTMEEADAKEASKILSDYYEFGEAR